jgi:alcohol dehydrogenase class IV
MNAHPWAVAHLDRCRALENEACRAVVAFGGGSRTRKAVSDALRAWRSAGDAERARWFRKHANFISGHLFK